MYISLGNRSAEAKMKWLLFQTAEKKCVPSALNWNCSSDIVDDKSCSATIQNAPFKRYTTKRELMTYQCGLPWGSFTKTILRISFKW